MTQALVVSNDVAGLADTLRVLGSAGYQAQGASSFEEAKRLLASGSPDLVIADQRLGKYNGLHVILRARASRPGLRAIVTTGMPDVGLEDDARRLNVACVVRPERASGWLTPVEKVLGHKRVRRTSNSSRQPMHLVCASDPVRAVACA